ncbi:hypothetical protein AAE478_001741 [Parahypoxylon ruwenzoriense]
MDYPEAEIPQVIRSLTQYSRQDQATALENYFLSDAYFIHPFCRVPSFGDITIPLTSWAVNSRWLVSLIYRWYRTLSPEISLDIDSTSFDKRTNLLYVTMRQTFTVWFVPFSLWQANVRLVTVLELRRLPVDEHHKPLLGGNVSPGYTEGDLGLTPQPLKLYFIKGQEDHYQIEDFLKFVAPWGASLFWTIWQLCATLVCAMGVALFQWPTAIFRERILGLDSWVVKKKQ